MYLPHLSVSRVFEYRTCPFFSAGKTGKNKREVQFDPFLAIGGGGGLFLRQSGIADTISGQAHIYSPLFSHHKCYVERTGDSLQLDFSLYHEHTTCVSFLYFSFHFCNCSLDPAMSTAASTPLPTPSLTVHLLGDGKLPPRPMILPGREDREANHSLLHSSFFS